MNFLIYLIVVFIILFLVYIAILLRNSGFVKIFGGKRPLEFLGNKRIFFFPHFLYGITASVNTHAAVTVGKVKKFRAENREKLIGVDGGEFFVDWFSKNEKSEDSTPIIILIHGINGGSSEPCISTFGIRLSKMGWKSCCLLFRGCSGTRLTTLRSYNGGYTEDLHVFLEKLSKQYPSAPVGIVGFSLGGNMLIKYLGERTSANRPIREFEHVKNKINIPQNVKAAVSVCPPHDYYRIDELLPKDFDKVVGRGMLFYCKKHDYMLSKIPTYQNLKDRKGDIFPREVDLNMNMHVFGYSSVKEFYDDCSDEKYIDGVGVRGEKSDTDDAIPLLMISSKNDPLSLESVIPYEKIEKNPNTALLLYPGGSHLGFFSYFSERRKEQDVAIRYLHYELLVRGKIENGE